MKKRTWGILASFVLMAGTIAQTVWWSVSHNAINVDCSNNLYRFHHLADCARWSLGNGIQAGIAVPLIIIGALGTLGLGFWTVMEHFDD